MNANKLTTKKLVITAMLAALTVAGSALRITLPLSIAGTTSFHLGNIMCALSGVLLGPWFGGLAAGLGSAIYDMFNPLYISECWITFLMKGAYGLVSGLLMWALTQKNTNTCDRCNYAAATISAFAGALTYAVLYLGKSYFYSGRFVKGLTHEAAMIGVIEKIPATTFNAVIAIIGAPILAVAIRAALKKAHLSID